MVTKVGRNILTQMCDYIKLEYEANIIYGDTDSLMICFGKGIPQEECIERSKRICHSVNNRLGEYMNLDFEDYINIIILFTKKRYIKINDGEIIGKGVVTARSNYCRYVKECYNRIVEMIRDDYHKDDITTEVFKFSLDLIDGCVPMNDLIIYKYVKPLEEYKLDNTPQYIMARRLMMEGYDWSSKLEYVFICNNSKRQGDKMYTPHEIKKYKMKIDYKYYLRIQLLPSLRDLFNILDMKDIKKNVLGMMRDCF